MGKRSGSSRKDKNKVILPPELPPEIHDDEVDVSEEDIEFYATDSSNVTPFRHFDKKSIDRLVSLGSGTLRLPIPHFPPLLLHCC
jgi:nucleolar complex protein 3